ncbi:MAG: hypothetical protein IPN94_26375 [Sphingobacteriales bacterium]|nr:hypothetical protein [Sphingobacteriales bacterium]
MAFADYINNDTAKQRHRRQPIGIGTNNTFGKRTALNQAHVANDFAMNSHLYSVFYFLKQH